MSASASERAQVYQALHRDYLDRFNSTRRIEWIVNGGLWTAIILGAATLRGHVRLDQVSVCAIAATAVGTGALHLLLWMLPIQISEDIDQRRADQYRCLTHLALTDRDLDVPGDPQERAALFLDLQREIPNPGWLPQRSFGLRFGGALWTATECVTTIVLVLFTLLFLKYSASFAGAEPRAQDVTKAASVANLRLKQTGQEALCLQATGVPAGRSTAPR